MFLSWNVHGCAYTSWQILEAAKSLHKSHKITIPFPDPKPDKNAAYKLAYAKPSTVNVVGSYVLKTMVKSDNALAVDMVVVMPISIFQDKDYLNYRYFYKRAYYLACVAAGLQDVVRDEFMLSFDYLNENDLHPILTLKPISGMWCLFQVKLMLTLDRSGGEN